MQTKIEKFANEAIYFLQLDSDLAISYIHRNAGVDWKTATAAFNQALTFHKKEAECKTAPV